MAHRMRPGRLQHLQEPVQIGPPIGARRLQRIADPRLGGEMGHHVGREARPVPRQQAGLGEVGLGEAEARMVEHRAQPRPLQRGIVIRVQVVEAEKTAELSAYLDKVSGVVNYVNQTFSLFKAAESLRPKRLLTPKVGE